MKHKQNNYKFSLWLLLVKKITTLLLISKIYNSTNIIHKS